MKRRAGSVLHSRQWRRIQRLFAEVIRTNLFLLDPTDFACETAERVTHSCSEIALDAASKTVRPPDCVRGAAQAWRSGNTSFFTCPHQLSYFVLPVTEEHADYGIIVGGPVLIGKRESTDHYLRLSKQKNIDPEVFLDRIREIKLYSHGSIRTVVQFLHELVRYVIRMAKQRGELERLVPGLLGSLEEQGVKFFSSAYLDQITSALLDIATDVVEADSGSVLLFDRNLEYFAIQSARGIRASIVEKRRNALKNNVAEWVAKKRRGLLIDRGRTNKGLRERLHRPEIRASMVVPLEFENRVLGVFCLNAKKANQRFNRQNLSLLTQLGRLASVGVSWLRA